MNCEPFIFSFLFFSFLLFSFLFFSFLLLVCDKSAYAPLRRTSRKRFVKKKARSPIRKGCSRVFLNEMWTYIWSRKRCASHDLRHPTGDISSSSRLRHPTNRNRVFKPISRSPSQISNLKSQIDWLAHLPVRTASRGLTSCPKQHQLVDTFELAITER